MIHEFIDLYERCLSQFQKMKSVTITFFFLPTLQFNALSVLTLLLLFFTYLWHFPCIDVIGKQYAIVCLWTPSESKGFNLVSYNCGRHYWRHTGSIGALNFMTFCCRKVDIVCEDIYSWTSSFLWERAIEIILRFQIHV